MLQLFTDRPSRPDSPVLESESATDQWVTRMGATVNLQPQEQPGSNDDALQEKWQEVSRCIQSDYDNNKKWSKSVVDKLGPCLAQLAGQDKKNVITTYKVIDVAQKIAAHLNKSQEQKVHTFDIFRNPSWKWAAERIDHLPVYSLPARSEREINMSDLQEMLRKVRNFPGAHIAEIFVNGSATTPEIRTQISTNVIHAILDVDTSTSKRNVLINSIYHPVVLSVGGEKVIATLDFIRLSPTLCGILEKSQSSHKLGELQPISLDEGGFSKDILRWINDRSTITLEMVNHITKDNVIPLIIAADYLQWDILRTAAITKFCQFLFQGDFGIPIARRAGDEILWISDIAKLMRNSGIKPGTVSEILNKPEIQHQINHQFNLYLQHHKTKSHDAFFREFCAAVLYMHELNMNVTSIHDVYINKAIGCDVTGKRTPEYILNAALNFSKTTKSQGFSQADAQAILSYPTLKMMFNNLFNRSWNRDNVREYQNNIISIMKSIQDFRKKLQGEGLIDADIDVILSYPIVQENIDGAFSRYLRLHEADLVDTLTKGIKVLADNGITIKSIGFDIGAIGNHEQRCTKFIECLKALHKHAPQLEKISVVGCFWLKHQTQFEPYLMKFVNLKAFRFALEYAKTPEPPTEQFEQFLNSRNGYGFDIAFRNMRQLFKIESIDMIDSNDFWHSPQSNVSDQRRPYWRQAIKYN